MANSNYQFTVTLFAFGDTPEEAWLNAVESLAEEPGTVPSDYVVIDVDDAFPFIR